MKRLGALVAGATLLLGGDAAAQQARDCKPGVSVSPRDYSPPSARVSMDLDCEDAEYELDLVGMIQDEAFSDRDLAKGKYFVLDDPDVYVSFSLRNNGEDVRDRMQYRERVGAGVRIPMPDFLEDVVEDVTVGGNYEVHGIHRGDVSVDAGMDVREDYFLDPLKRFFGLD